ncbi:hypothetical protein E4U41_003283 [Claviceps citrina]|nr:hypothetical protein E4U41_003283 [Claviceps citrina]
MILVRDSDDVEIYSATGRGAIQGSGWELHKDGKYGPRIMRLQKCSNFSVHDFVLVDSPKFHLSLDTCTNGEVYNLVIHGGHKGGLDGIDVWGSNIWVHDVEVSNRDENIYTHHSNHMYMIKSRGGSGSVSAVTLENFIGHSNAYGLDLDTDWTPQLMAPGPGVAYSDINFSNWKGTSRVERTARAGIRVLCPALVPCRHMLIRDVDIWKETGEPAAQACQNAYGSGACLADGNATAPSGSNRTAAVTAMPADFAGALLPNELDAGFDVSQPIPIPKMPAMFFPGVPPKSKVLACETSRPTSA